MGRGPSLDRTGETLLDKYRLTRLIGRGGMGEVWEGQHMGTGRRVAVKVLSEVHLSNKKIVHRFGREARAASAVQHPGIVEILDEDRTPSGVPFLVMEFLAGESLGARLRRVQRLSQDNALDLAIPLLGALDAAHANGVVHRDLKPDNVYLTPGPRGEDLLKILDFGISKTPDEIDRSITQEGSVLGTPHYMSPEQARGQLNIDMRVDVYAAAVLLYECLVGQVPFQADNYNALMQMILTVEPVNPSGRGVRVSGPVEQVLMTGLFKDRDMRLPSARVFLSLLQQGRALPDGARLDRERWRFDSVMPPKPPLGYPADGRQPAISGSAPSRGAPWDSASRGLAQLNHETEVSEMAAAGTGLESAGAVRSVLPSSSQPVSESARAIPSSSGLAEDPRVAGSRGDLELQYGASVPESFPADGLPPGGPLELEEVEDKLASRRASRNRPSGGSNRSAIRPERGTRRSSPVSVRPGAASPARRWGVAAIGWLFTFGVIVALGFLIDRVFLSGGDAGVPVESRAVGEAGENAPETSPATAAE